MKTKLNYDEALKQADHIISLDELIECIPDSLLQKRASAMIKYHGFYSYIDAEENLKIFVTP